MLRELLALLILVGSGLAQADSSGGEYLFNVAGCLACHTAEDGAPLAGGRPFKTPHGVFYSPNISPDRETGIGAWSRIDFIRALRHGRAPDDSAYFPVFPYPSYRLMTAADAGSIYDYLMSQAPRKQSNRSHELPWWLGRWMMKPWQWWLQNDLPAEAKPNRGRYLVDALGHCGECHTPRDWAGVLDHARYLAGTPDGPDGDPVPNITPHRGQGIGKWSTDDLDYFLETGELPDGDYTGDAMVEVIDNATSRLTPADRRAIVDYLQSIAPDPGS